MHRVVTLTNYATPRALEKIKVAISNKKAGQRSIWHRKYQAFPPQRCALTSHFVQTGSIFVKQEVVQCVDAPQLIPSHQDTLHLRVHASAAHPCPEAPPAPGAALARSPC